eukprot:UN12617
MIDILNNVSAAGTGYDLLDVSGQVNFGGTLQLAAMGGYTVTGGDVFTPINYSTTTGAFSILNSIAGESIATDYTAPDLTITLTIGSAFTWNGLVDTDWFNTGNWVGGVVPLISTALLFLMDQLLASL